MSAKPLSHSFSLVLLICAASSNIAAAQDAENWALYDFTRTSYIEFDVTATADGEKQTGTTILEFVPKGAGQMTLNFKATLGESSAQFSTTAADDEVYGQAMIQMMMTPTAMPMMATMFAPFWGAVFVGRDMSVGAGWSFSDGTNDMSFKVESTCSQAGLQGKNVVWRQSGEVRAEACVNVEVPLPLAVSMKTDDGQQFEVTMKEYRSRP